MIHSKNIELMNPMPDDPVPGIDGILHPTDFTEGSRAAFHHALMLAFTAKTPLTLMHVSTDATSEWTDFPGVRQTLEKWGWLPKDSPRSALPQLGVDVRKVIARQDDPVQAVLHYLDRHPAGLVVLSTHQHEGRVRWLHQSVAEPVARQSGQMSLFIPGGLSGFVSAETGAVLLDHILIPIAAAPRPQPAIEAAARLAAGLKLPHGSFTILHVGEVDTMPVVHCPEVPGWDWKKVIVPHGDVIVGIVETASKMAAGLIVMATDGRHGFLDALRGSHSERVLRHAPAPLLTVPAGSPASNQLP